MRPTHPSSKTQVNLIAIGDSQLDTFLEIQEAIVTKQKQKKQRLLCLNYGDKIPVTHITHVPGAGNASNAAVSASRLGLKSALVSIIGSDATGRTILAQWKKEGIQTHQVIIDTKQATNEATVINFKSERTILTHNQPRTYRLPKLPSTDWIYYTALGNNHTILEREIITYLTKHPATKLAFNPGTTHLQRGLKALLPLLKLTTVFAVNKEEAHRLLEDDKLSIPMMLAVFHRLGATVVLITDGGLGSYATDGQSSWFCPIFPVTVKEVTGAGDSFTSSFVAALHHGLAIPEAMRVGTANAWSVVQHIGPQAGLLTSHELRLVLKKFSRVQPRLQRI